MTVTCEEIEFCKVKVNFVADPDAIEEKQEEVLKRLKDMDPKVPGFRQALKRKNTKSQKRKKGQRKGKSSTSFKDSPTYEKALCKNYKKYIEDNVKQELVSEGIDETIFETKMKPVGYPEVSNVMYDGSSFSCDMVFLKKPDFELNQYKDFEIPKPHSNETAEEVAESMIQELRVQHGDVVPYEEGDFLQDGDQVTIDVEASSSEENLDHLTQQGILYTVGSQTYEEFDQNLYGMKPGEDRQFDIIFPEEETVHEKLQGKRVTFKVKLHMGTKRKLHPLDDDLAKKAGLENYDQLHQQCVAAANNKLESRERMMLSQQVTTRLLENNEFEVPSWLVLMESQNMARNMGRKWDELSDEEIEMINESSKKSVRLSMILDSIREEEPESSFTTQELVNKIAGQIAAQGQNPHEVLSKAEKDGSLLGEVARLRDESTIQWVLDNSKIVE